MELKKPNERTVYRAVLDAKFFQVSDIRYPLINSELQIFSDLV